MTIEEAKINNGNILIAFIRRGSKKIPRQYGLNGETTSRFNMNELILNVTEVVKELLKLTSPSGEHISSVGSKSIVPIMESEEHAMAREVPVMAGGKLSKTKKKTKGKRKKKEAKKQKEKNNKKNKKNKKK